MGGIEKHKIDENKTVKDKTNKYGHQTIFKKSCQYYNICKCDINVNVILRCDGKIGHTYLYQLFNMYIIVHLLI